MGVVDASTLDFFASDLKVSLHTTHYQLGDISTHVFSWGARRRRAYFDATVRHSNFGFLFGLAAGHPGPYYIFLQYFIDYSDQYTKLLKTTRNSC